MDNKAENEIINSFLEQPLIARLATADRNGQPHVVPVWYLWDGESIWISSYETTNKVRDIKENPAISVVIDVTGDAGMTRAVVFEGKAELVREPRDFLREQFTRIYQRYLGKEGVLGADPQVWIKDPQNLLICLTPEKTMTWNW